MGTKFDEVDAVAVSPDGRELVPGPDAHVIIAPYFTVPEGRMDDYKAGLGKSYSSTRARTGEYSFAAHRGLQRVLRAHPGLGLGSASTAASLCTATRCTAASAIGELQVCSHTLAM